MKYTFSLILLLISTIVLASINPIGCTRQQIREAYPNEKFTMNDLGDGTTTLHTSDDFRSEVYYFNSQNVCYLKLVFPLSQDYCNKLIELFNKSYVVISDTEWTSYTKTGIVHTKYMNNNGVYFSIY